MNNKLFENTTEPTATGIGFGTLLKPPTSSDIIPARCLLKTIEAIKDIEPKGYKTLELAIAAHKARYGKKEIGGWKMKKPESEVVKGKDGYYTVNPNQPRKQVTMKPDNYHETEYDAFK